jgi:hypothetical protein
MVRVNFILASASAINPFFPRIYTASCCCKVVYTGNIGKLIKCVCYNEWQWMSAAWLAQPFPGIANHIRLGTLYPQ